MSNTLVNNLPNEGDRQPAESLLIEILADDPLPAPWSEAEWDVKLRTAIEHALAHRKYRCGEIGVRITEDSVIREINRRHLDHDYETDVISFGYLADPPQIAGELVVSIETARRSAAEAGWPLANELLLYVVHGTLHITGMEDQDPCSRAEMRIAERDVLRQLGIEDAEKYAPAEPRSSEIHAPGGSQ
ncbi:rRNA maturation RNase YbeY [Novipirellula artificiosorum]|uniref:Endoribonuclease YbeY n=1 Tax=Novipirellula artificiosorum TaxID=2528016 RepID=A0A5C6DK65_9BACT|nr:rRNA maturation RNase YbeY [Novipirellula artificiosorum]TWU37012.1 Endoribonuclease YbeY [Novipirellula artificiosorum]